MNQVKVERAESLPKMDRIGWIDAYITLALSGETAKTSIKKKKVLQSSKIP